MYKYLLEIIKKIEGNIISIGLDDKLLSGFNKHEKVNVYTLSTITDEQRNNYDYISLMTENLEKIKKELYN